MIFRIAAIFLVVMSIIGIFLGIFVLEEHSPLDIIGIIGIAINGIVFLLYIVKKKKKTYSQKIDVANGGQ